MHVTCSHTVRSCLSCCQLSISLGCHVWRRELWGCEELLWLFISPLRLLDLWDDSQVFLSHFFILFGLPWDGPLDQESVSSKLWMLPWLSELLPKSRVLPCLRFSRCTGTWTECSSCWCQGKCGRWDKMRQTVGFTHWEHTVSNKHTVEYHNSSTKLLINVDLYTWKLIQVYLLPNM